MSSPDVAGGARPEVPSRSMNMVRSTKYSAESPYNDSPGTGRTGMFAIPPNNYDFYTEEEKYKPLHAGDCGVFSDWQPMYEPSTVKADADRLLAFEKGAPRGLDVAGSVPEYRAVGNSFAGEAERLKEKYKSAPTLRLLIASKLHRDEEYGGPFWIEVPSKTRVFELRRVIAHQCGVMPGLQRLTFAGKKMDDSERNLEHYGIKYWNKKFPDWPIVMRRF